MRQFIHSALLLSVCAVLTAPAMADQAAVEAAVEQFAPNADQVAISETVVDDLYEVRFGSEIVYITGSGQHLLQGRLIDLESREDLTEKSRAKVRLKVLQDIDPSEEIVFAPEDPVHELTVFTDIDCGYCRKLHNEIETYMDQGIAVRYMMFPRSGPETPSFDKAISVWCADDKQAALTDAKAGNEPEPLQCENPVRSQYDTGVSIGVTGTPALFTESGVHIPGYVPAEQLRARLDALAATTTAAASSSE